jgi:hypothetical protein
VTDRHDFAADFVIVRLRERGLPYFRLNSDQLWSTPMTLTVGGGCESQRWVSCESASVDLDDVGSIWYRRAIRPPVNPSVDPDYRLFAASELRHSFEGLLADPAIRWVNPPAATELAERKVYQLRTAQHHGLRVPPTIISTNRDELLRFAGREERVICKPISQGLVSVGGADFAMHTREVTYREIVDANTLGGVPTLLQRSIPKGTDIRVTIIGDSVFPVEILLPRDAPVDWRATRAGITYRSCTLPHEVEGACRSLMAALDISYGAFDFIRPMAPNGIFWK